VHKLYRHTLANDYKCIDVNDIVKPYSTLRAFKTYEKLAKYLADNPVSATHNTLILDTKVVRFREAYSSVYEYDLTEFDEWNKEHNTMRNYTGSVTTGQMYFSWTSSISVDDLKLHIIPFLRYMRQHGVPFTLFFTGGQGITCYIPSSYVTIPDTHTHKANIVCKTFAKQCILQFPELESVTDMKVYGTHVTLGMPFSLNSSTGNIRTMMRFNESKSTFEKVELTELLIIGMYEMLKVHQSVIATPVWTLDVSLLVAKPIPDVMFNVKYVAPKNECVCIYNVLNTRLSAGDHREEMALRIMSWCKTYKLLPMRMTYKLLQGWNETLEEPMLTSVMDKLIRSYSKVSYNLCTDNMMLQYCPKDTSCPYWNTKASELDVSMKDALTAIIDDANDNSTVIDFGKIFTGMNLHMKPSRGEILIIIMGSKVGKTTTALNIALRAQVPTVMFSYEMSKRSVLDILAKMLGLDPLDQLDQAKLVELTKHIFVIDEGLLALQDMESCVKDIERKFCVEIEMVVFDYLGITPVYDINRKGRYISGLTEKIDTIAQLLPEIAKRNRWLVVIPAQPTKGVEGGGSVMLMPDSGKGGQGIMAMANAIMTGWRPYKNNDPFHVNTLDKVMSLWVGVNRSGAEDIVHNYNYYADERVIQGLYLGEVEQKPPIEYKN